MTMIDGLHQREGTESDQIARLTADGAVGADAVASLAETFNQRLYDPDMCQDPTRPQRPVTNRHFSKKSKKTKQEPVLEGLFDAHEEE